MASTSPNKSSKSPKFGTSLVALPLFPSVSPSPFFSPTPLFPLAPPPSLPSLSCKLGQKQDYQLCQELSQSSRNIIDPPTPPTFSDWDLGTGTLLRSSPSRKMPCSHLACTRHSPCKYFLSLFFLQKHRHVMSCLYCLSQLVLRVISIQCSAK